MTFNTIIGFDAWRVLTSDDDERAGLRCIVLRLDMRRGVGRVDPLVLDTTLSQLNGQGSISSRPRRWRSL
ncbi:hypothetical protein ACVWZA_000232 [Sphingomonas sp. UYAg733]